MSVCLNELNIDDSIFCTPLSLSLFLLQTYLSLDVISFALWCFLFNLNFYCIFIFALLILNWKFYKALSSFFLFGFKAVEKVLSFSVRGHFGQW